MFALWHYFYQIFNKLGRSILINIPIHQIVVTPTRVLFCAPELLMGNRVLRLDVGKFPLEKFLRVVFRNDDLSAVHVTNADSFLIEKFIGKKLKDGIPLAGISALIIFYFKRHFIFAGRLFNYFCSSNSQLRDNGCYFINANFQEIDEIRKELGAFKIESAPRMMSQIGLCLTQARVSNS
jgi:hypothetical protein